MTDQAVLPYAGTSGWSGSETSKERALSEDSQGITAQRQRKVMTELQFAGEFGLTWKELANSFGWHHGQASGVLSVLHKEGFISRLTERRDRCAVYVLPNLVKNRDVSDHGRKKHTCSNCGFSE